LKITILKHHQHQPQELLFPTVNPHFTNLRQPITNKIPITEQRLPIFMHQGVYDTIWQHANSNKTIELGGALLGLYARHQQTKFLVITNVLNQPETYFADPTFVKFTNQFYTDLEDYLQQINTRFPMVVRLGLYHTHPNYGVYLSKTDATAFKRVTSENYQVSLIVDPVKQEDGFFFWLSENPTTTNDISDRGAYKVYNSAEPILSPYQATTHNYHLAKCNSFLTFTGNAAAIELVTPEYHNQTTEIAPSTDTESEKINADIDKISIPIEHIKKPPEVLLPCPLYSMAYDNRAINLKNYFRTLKNIHRHKFPYMVFLPDDFGKITAKPLAQNQTQIALLYGKLARDPHKDLPFLLITHIENCRLPLTPFTNLPSQLKELLIQAKSGNIHFHEQLLGWLVITSDTTTLPYHFYDLQQLVLPDNYYLGFLLQTKAAIPPDVQNLTLVAYDHLLDIPYNHYDNVYICKIK